MVLILKLNVKSVEFLATEKKISSGTGMVCGDGWLNAVPTAFMISNGLLYLYGQNSAATMLVINMTYVAMGSVVA